MNQIIWNKIIQTHDLFKRIIAPLKEHLNMGFGYMIIFNDGSYYQIIENLDCLQKWVDNVETSHIFCSRNVTNYFDAPYHFTIWPEEPTCHSMELYKEYGIWNGVTISRMNKNHTELYWFTKENREDGWYKWFIRNKQFLLKFIKYFTDCKPNLHISNEAKSNEMFKFRKKFSRNLIESEYLRDESLLLDKTENSLKSNHMLENLQANSLLSQREMEILAIISRGYTAKTIAYELNITLSTVNTYIERIKIKTGLHFKTELIRFYEKSFLK